MSKEKVRVVRVPPNSPPILDEITVTPNQIYVTHMYVNIKPYGDIDGSEFEGIWLDEEEEIVCYFIDKDLAVDITEKEMLFQYNTTLIELSRNRDVLGHRTYGDLIIKAEGRSLTPEEVDRYIEMFREDKPSKGVNEEI